MTNNKKHRRRRRRNKATAIIIAAVILIALIAACFAIVKIFGAPVSSDETVIPFYVNEGDTYKIVGENLYKEGFIKNEAYYNIYLKVAKPGTLYAGCYPLSKSMSLKEILSKIASGETYLPDAIYITFPEGKNIPQIAQIIEDNTSNSKESFYAALKDEVFLDELIGQYWFLTDTIKSSKIYYSIEGYLFPETYQLSSEDASISEIIRTMLNQTENVLAAYKDEIEAGSFSAHEILTLASIVELEALNDSDRANVAGVFYNRLNKGIALGSDVTAYYGAKVDMAQRDLYMSELNASNGYNTRNSSKKGLPVGPICCPGKTAIIAAIEPEKNEYLFFVADKNNKTYFSKTNSEHEKTVQRLKDEGLWFEY